MSPPSHTLTRRRGGNNGEEGGRGATKKRLAWVRFFKKQHNVFDLLTARDSAPKIQTYCQYSALDRYKLRRNAKLQIKIATNNLRGTHGGGTVCVGVLSRAFRIRARCESQGRGSPLEPIEDFGRMIFPKKNLLQVPYFE